MTLRNPHRRRNLPPEDRLEWKGPGQTERWLRVRLTEAEQLAIKSYCAGQRLEVSAFVRSLVFGTIGLEALRQASAALHRPSPVHSNDPDLDF